MKLTNAVYASSRREMWAIFAIWGVFCAWVAGYCKLRAYDRPGDELSLVLGMPSWVFWGIAVPWCAATVVSIVFALSFMEDHSLDAPDDGEPGTPDDIANA